MSEPRAKKTKLSREDSSIFNFTKGTEPCDRDLIVENTVYHVHSQTLIDNSEYFRVMFTSDFLEKNKYEIEIKGVDENEMGLFLRSIFEPENVEVTEENLPVMCKVFGYFQATGYFVEFLKKKNVFEEFPARDMLKMSIDYTIPEIKVDVEAFLVAEFPKKFPVIRQKSKENADGSAFDKHIIDSLDLIAEFGLTELKETVEARLSSDFVRSKFYSIYSNLDEKYFQLLKKYELENLAQTIEAYALDMFNKEPHRYFDILEPYIIALEPKLNHLKEHIEKHYLDSMKPNEDRGNYIFKQWEIIRNHYNNLRGNRYEPWDYDSDDDFPPFVRKTLFTKKNKQEIAMLSSTIITSSNLNLATFMEKIEEFLLNETTVLAADPATSERDQLEMAIGLLPLTKKLSKFKAAVEKYLVARFAIQMNEFPFFEYSEFLKYCNTYDFVELKEFIRKHLTVQYELAEDERDLKMNNDTFIELAFTFNLEPIKTTVENYFIKKLKNSDGLDDAFLQKCCDYSIKYKMAKIKEAFESYLIKDFQKSRSFKNLKFVFIGFRASTFDDNNFEAFRKTVTDYLKTVNLDDAAIKAGRKYIEELPANQELFVFKAMLRRHD